MLSPSHIPQSKCLQPPSHKRHGHKRSSAISGDFDFNNIFASSSSALVGSPTMSLKKTPPPMPQIHQIPSVNIDDGFAYDSTSSATTSTPPSVQLPASCSPISASSQPQPRFFMTDELKFENSSTVPNAIIDLDDIITKPNSASYHRRSDSAPYDFAGFGSLMVSSSAPAAIGGPNSTSNMERFLLSPVRNEIVEEEEEESDTASILSHLFSKAKDSDDHSSLNLIFSHHNSSTSLHSITQLPQQSHSLTSDKSPSVSSLRGKLARYQNYYYTQQKVGSVKPSSTSALKLKQLNSTSLPTSRSSSKSPTRVVPGFKFESVPYDIPQGMLKNYYGLDSGATSGNSTSTVTPGITPTAAGPAPMLPVVLHNDQQLPLRSSSPLRNEITNAAGVQPEQKTRKHLHDRSKSLSNTTNVPLRNTATSKTHLKQHSKSSSQHNFKDSPSKTHHHSKQHEHKRSRSLFNSLTKIHLGRNSISSTNPGGVSSSSSSRSQHSRASSIASSGSVISKTANEALIHYRASSERYRDDSMNTTITDSTQTIPAFAGANLTLTNLGEPGPMVVSYEPEDSILGDLDPSSLDQNSVSYASSSSQSNFSSSKRSSRHRWWFRKKNS